MQGYAEQIKTKYNKNSIFVKIMFCKNVKIMNIWKKKYVKKKKILGYIIKEKGN